MNIIQDNTCERFVESPSLMSLFFNKYDTIDFLDALSLMQVARDTVVSSNLIGGCELGSRSYIEDFFVGFWPFVSQLEKIVDERQLPREPLNVVAGSKNEATRKLIAISRTRDQLVKQEASAIGWLSTRKATHAAYWREDARKLGIDLFAEMQAPGIRQLIKTFKDAETPADFFACLVAGEMIALALGEELGPSGAFNYHGRSLWIDAHLVKSEVSVLDINMSFLRAYQKPDSSGSTSARQSVLRVIELFGVASDSVFDELL